MKNTMTPERIAEIGARLSRLICNGVIDQVADYHAIMHTDIPALLTALEEAQAELERLKSRNGALQHRVEYALKFGLFDGPDGNYLRSALKDTSHE